MDARKSQSLQQATSSLDMSNQTTLIQGLQQTTAQGLDSLQSTVEAIVPTLKKAFESENGRQNDTEDKRMTGVGRITTETLQTTLSIRQKPGTTSMN
jgi:hypothetical protein